MSKELLQHSFRHSWQDCAIASWQKWPNPRRPDVVSVDIINKHYDEETGQLHATRLLILKSWLPAWVRAITGGTSLAYFVEESVTDPLNERLVLNTTNLTLDNVLRVNETCVYTAQDGDSRITRFEQQAHITAYPWGVARKLERWSVDMFVANAQKGRDIMEEIIQRVEEEAVSLREKAQSLAMRFEFEKEEESIH